MTGKTTWVFCAVLLCSLFVISAFSPVGLQSANAAAGVDIRVQVTPSFVRTYNWNLQYAVTPETWTAHMGDQVIPLYALSLDRTYQDSQWQAQGSVFIKNNTKSNIHVRDIRHSLPFPITGNCTPALPVKLKPGAVMNCTFRASLPDASLITDVVTVRLDGKYKEVSFTAVINFASAQVHEINKTIHINTQQAPLQSWTASQPTTLYEEVAYDCPPAAGETTTTYVRQVMITETGQMAEAMFALTCVPLITDESSSTDFSFDVNYEWSPDKTVDQEEVTLQVGEQTQVNYTVSPNPSFYYDDFKLFGYLQVQAFIRPVLIQQILVRVDDGSPTIEGVVCDVSLPYLLNQGENFSCNFQSAFPAGGSGTLTWQVLAQTEITGWDGSTQPGSFHSFVSQAEYSFYFSPKEWGQIEDHNDAIIYLADSLVGELGISTGQHWTIFEYVYPIGPYPACGEYVVENTVWYSTWGMPDEDQHDGSDTQLVSVHVPCP